MAPHEHQVQVLLHHASAASNEPLRVVLLLAPTNGNGAAPITEEAVEPAVIAEPDTQPSAEPEADQAADRSGLANGGSSFKHIQPVLDQVSGTAARAERLYRWLRENTVPPPAARYLDALEQALLTHTQPWSKTGDNALHLLDDHIDNLLLLQHKVAAGPDAWVQVLEALAQHPRVAALLHALQPATDCGLRTLHTVHDHLVPSPYYKAAVDLGTGTLSFASSTSAAKLAARVFNPVVQPIADVANKSEVVHTAIDYWKPTYAPTPVSAS